MGGRDVPPPPSVRLGAVREVNIAPARYGPTQEDEALRRIVRAAMNEVIHDLRDGLEQRIRSAVTAEVAPILQHLEGEKRDKEDYRRDRERRERLSEVRVRKAEVELDVIERDTLDRRIDGRHKRTIAWVTALALVLSPLAALLGATVTSHLQAAPAPTPPAAHGEGH